MKVTININSYEDFEKSVLKKEIKKFIKRINKCTKNPINFICEIEANDKKEILKKAQ